MDDIRFLVKDIKKRIEKKQSLPDFFTLLRYIESKYPKKTKLGYALNYEDEIIRFSQVPHLKFAESEIADIDIKDDKVLLKVYFFGLLGPNSVMPLEFTNFVMNRSLNHQDKGIQSFLDIINHRMLSLYYKAKSVNNQTLSFSKEEDNFYDMISSFCANTQNLHRDKKHILPYDTQITYAHFLSKKIRSKDGLEKILSTFFKLPFRILTHINTKSSIPKEFLCVLSNPKSAILGKNTQIGKHYFSKNKRIILELDQISLKDYKNFIPRSLGFLRLIALINMYLSKPIEYIIKFRLKKDSDVKSYLDAKSALGVNSWLSSKNAELDIQINAFNWALKMKGSKLNG
ncbi:type VI secretion system baseplate subunit TssG [Campylobacter avium]|uniref:type VI secretion system baseplate subunit TssG n=1 Tax=Campylobacter avium TaxID=522485 RepID=UPI0023544676|nr:type VI secretion system baseplate subunit TssG [Campylobacter avium]